MEWRIRESARGYYAEYGGQISSGINTGYVPGCFMSCFHVSESARFDTRAQAERYIKRRIGGKRS